MSIFASCSKSTLPSQVGVYLYGSLARRDRRWSSDYDRWIDADISRQVIAEMTDKLDQSFVPFRVNIDTTPQFEGRFAERVKGEAIPWM
jgi:predicted nucleotidyltransferase